VFVIGTGFVFAIFRFAAALEGDEQALAGAAETAFVAAEGGEGAGVVAEGAEGDGGADLVVDDVVILFDLRLLVGHFEVDEGGLDGPDAIEAPAGVDQLVDEVEVVAVFGLVLGEVAVAQAGEVLFGLAGEDDFARSEAVSEGVHGGAGAAFRGDGALREGAVGARRIEFSLGRHFGMRVARRKRVPRD
jgi:hypothetical protein